MPFAISTACWFSSSCSHLASVARHCVSACSAPASIVASARADRSPGTIRAITPSHAVRSAWPRSWTRRTPAK
jgi:hypothetical protein